MCRFENGVCIVCEIPYEQFLRDGIQRYTRNQKYALNELVNFAKDESVKMKILFQGWKEEKQDESE